MLIKTDEISDGQKLALLVRRNLYFHFRHKKQLLFIIFAPLLFTLILLIARINTEVEFVPILRFKEINLSRSWELLWLTIEERRRNMMENVFQFKPNVLVPNYILAWAPHTRIAFKQIMDGARELLDEIPLKSFGSCEELRASFTRHSYFAGVCFNETSYYAEDDNIYWLIDGVYPSQLEFTLVFPSELRIYEDAYIGIGWSTFTFFNKIKNVEERVSAKHDGGFVGYAREGFLTLQKAISESYLALIKNDSIVETMPEVAMRRFLYREHLYDSLLEHLYLPIELITIFSYLYPMCIFTTQIVLEKENGMRVELYTMGNHSWLYNTSWLISEVMILMCSNIVLITVLKVYTNQGYSILTKSEFLALFLYLFFYSVATVNLCILLATLMSNSRNATFLTPLFWLLMFVVNLRVVNESEQSIVSQVLVCLFSHCTMAMVWHIVLYFEMYAEGFGLYSFIDTDAVDETIPVSLCCIIFIMQALVYYCLALCTDHWNPGPYSAKSKWHGVVTTGEWMRVTGRVKDAIKSTRAFTSSVTVSGIPKPEDKPKELVASVTNLCKSYDKVPLLENISLSLYTGEITVLLGHNGCGKSTLFKIMVGILQPTSGSVLVQRFNVHNESENVVARIGLAMQDNILLPEMTFSEQIFFYGRMKGLNKAEAHEAVDKYCKALDLEAYRYINTDNLLVGIRHMLGICCALAGKNQLVLIDGLGHGLDMYSRSLVWDLLISEKKRNRSILLSTHSMESSEVLADRVIIMSNGKIKCSGSADFLRSTYRYGYHLICMKNENCMSKYVTEFIQKFIPNITPISEIGKKITYIIAPHYEDRIVPLVDKLEQHLDDIYLESFAIDGKTAEDVYLGMLADDSINDAAMGLHQILNGLCTFESENTNPTFLKHYKRLKSAKLWLAQCYALMFKRFIQIKRNLVILLVRLFLPIVLCLFAFFAVNTDHNKTTETELSFSLMNYEETLTMAAAAKFDNNIDAMQSLYEQVVMSMPEHEIIIMHISEFENTVLDEQTARLRFTNKKMIIGVYISPDQIIGYFNNYPLHSAPLSMNMVYNSIAKLYVDNAGIKVHFHPIPFALENTYPNKYAQMTLNSYLSLAVPLALVFTWSSSILIMTSEKKTGFKMMQFLAGARVNTYWLVTFLFDLLFVLVTSSCVILLFRIFCIPTICAADQLRFYWWAMILHGVTIVSFNYLVMHLFDLPTIAFLCIIIFHTFSLVLFFIINDLFSLDNYGFDQPIIIHNWMSLLPVYNFASMMWRIYKAGELNLLCMDEVIEMISVFEENCEEIPNCCREPYNLKAPDGVFVNVCICLSTILICWITHILIEFMIMYRPSWLVRAPPLDNLEAGYMAHKRIHAKEELAINIDDVTAENVRTFTLKPREARNKAVLCQHLGKTFHNKFAIERLNFIVEHYQCFGILGSNYSGKTVLMQLMSGAIPYSFGRITIDGIVMHKDRGKVLKRISYSPQVAAVMNEFTPCEIMTIYAQLYGVPPNLRKEICESLVKTLGFYAYYHQMLRKCSDGNKRRMSSAIAMLSRSSSVIYMDDPSAGVDPIGKRQFYNIISKIRLTGTAIVMTTYSSRECEGFCNRLAILMDGKFFSVGSTMDLQDKFGLGYMLQLRMDRAAKGMNVSLRKQLSSRKYLKVITFIESVFPGAVLKARRSNVLYFFLLLKPNKIASIFEIIAPNIEEHNILEFSISRCTLGTIYLELMERHKFFSSHNKPEE